MSSCHENRDALDPRASIVLTVAIAAFLTTYAWLFVQGYRFLVIKTAILPIFLLYAGFLRKRMLFVVDWLPFLVGTVLFDVLRGSIYDAIQLHHRQPYAHYVIDLEHLFFRVPAVPVVFQAWRSNWLDAVCVGIHASHFFFFLIFGLAVWHSDRSAFLKYRQCVLLVMAVGLAGYVAVPTVPPWMASQWHLLPVVRHVTADVYSMRLPEFYGTFDVNPVAAMPSLHVAFPTACAAVGWNSFGRRVGLWLAFYAVLVAFSVMYLGEHYATDVVAGIAVGLACAWTSRRSAFDLRSPTLALAVSAAGIALAYALAEWH